MYILTDSSKDYPDRLKTIDQPPRQLFVEGNLKDISNLPSVAVVGSRKASQYGMIATTKIVKEIASRGVLIVSGLALGIDSIAHKSALEAGGRTLAVLPTGLDNIYPSSHYSLSRQIIKQSGVLLTEYPPKATAFKANFIARNRIIAGLADIVLVAEAAIKSGSLYTANFALEQGRDVYAIPGPITSPTSEGCNNLIRSGAGVATSGADILNALNISAAESKIDFFAQNHEEQIILELIASGVTDGEILLPKSGLKIEIFQQTISMLEITGKISSGAGNQFTLR